MASKIQVPLSFASPSIGLPRHPLPRKLSAISSANFQGIELAFPDLLSFASTHFNRPISETDYDSLCEAGTEVRKLCEGYKLKVIVLQPFSNFEGWPEGSREREQVFEKARGWIRIMGAVGTDMLQSRAYLPPYTSHPYVLSTSLKTSLTTPSQKKVGSSDSPNITSSPQALASDLAQLADLLAPHSFRLAYENWCWATHAPTWKSVWRLIQLANRPNIGLCLDTFQTAGGEWGDPTTPSGLIENGGGITETEVVTTAYKISLDELVKTVPSEQIYFLQISDALRMQPPMSKDVDDDERSGTRARGRWSHAYRPLPYDGGYLPIVQFAEAVLATGFRGWFSIEVFDGRFEEKWGDDLEGYAKKAREAHERMMAEVKL
ncbi:MAG: hypothetical protein Q9227_005668 [Pyrenula ochraceoflavens]